MPGEILVYIGAAVIVFWGAAHIAPVKSVVAGFGPVSDDNRRIITMEWVAEGLALMFIGLIAALVTLAGGTQNPVSLAVLYASAAMLLVMAVWTAFTGARTSNVPMKICPVVKTVVALLFLAGSFL